MVDSPPPTGPYHLARLGQAMAREGRLAEAELALAAAARLLGDDPEIFYLLGQVCLAQGKLTEAKAALSEAVQAYPAHAEALAGLGDIALIGRDEAEARRQYDRALAFKPDLRQARIGLARIALAARRPDDARPLLAAVLAAEPADDEARQLLGAAMAELGERAARVALWQEAVAARPEAVNARLGLAEALDGNNRQEEALVEIDRALAAAPDHRPLKTYRAKLLAQLGRADEAVAELEALVAAQPDDVEALFQLGNACLAHKANARALAAFERALALRPDSVEFLNNLANAELALERREDAIRHLEAAIARDPNFVNAYNNLGIALVALGRIDQACAIYERALAIAPKMVAAMVNLGNAHRAAGRLDQALSWYRNATVTEPGNAAAWNSVGLALQQHHRHYEAIEAFEKAIALDDRSPQAWNNLAISQQDLGRYRDAMQSYMQALAIDPTLPEIYINLGAAVQIMGSYETAIDVYMRAIRLNPGLNVIYPMLAHMLMNLCSWKNLDSVIAKVVANTEAEMRADSHPTTQVFAMLGLPTSAEHRAFVSRKISKGFAVKVRDLKAATPLPHVRPRRHRKIRVGYISPDFRMHSVGAAFRGLLDNHDRDDFEWYGYALTPFAADAMTRHFQAAFDRFEDVSEATFADAARLIHGHEIDILVDLAGHTRGTRLEILALEPAPVQAHYLGFGATCGADYIPYLITDRMTMPADLARHCTEKLVYLPDTFMAVTHAEVAAVEYSRTEEKLPAEGPVFCNFNSHSKFHPSLWDVWMRLLRRVPEASFWMMQGPDTAMANLRAEAEARGVDAERLRTAVRRGHPEHLARLKLADFAVDCRFHAGGVTTVDALWVGVPVVTLAAETSNGRTGASILSAMGLPELVAESVDAYEALCLKLLTDRDHLRRVRAKLAENRRLAPLFDIERLTRHLESAYRLMWENWLEGNPPRPIEVPPLPARGVPWR
ncbi:MAG: tetratricopeptide repeat protein [Alphaproteobacteria bacterium]|nr:tetratricopeptide repeat protein [Alphaproteobacteria bacterium]